MLSTPFERPIALDLSRDGLRRLEPLVWALGALQVGSAAIAPGLKWALLAWAAVCVVARVRNDRDGGPYAARWHPCRGWQLRFRATGWQDVVLDGGHPISTSLQLLCWRHPDGRRWCRLVGPTSAPDPVRRRLRVLLRFGRLRGDG
jgi:hypothetical protein